MQTEILTVTVRELQKGDILLGSGGVVTHSPYDSVGCPKGKANLGVDGKLKVWGKSTTIKIKRG